MLRYAQLGQVREDAWGACRAKAGDNHEAVTTMLSNRQEIFAREVAKGLPCEKAYEKAGYKASRAARTSAVQLLAKAAVKERVEEIQARAARRAEVTIADVVLELSRIGFSNQADYVRTESYGRGGRSTRTSFALAEVSREKMAAVQSIKIDEAGNVVEVKLWDKKSALVDLGKYLGMWKESLALTGPDGGAVQVEDVSAARQFVLGELARLASRKALPKPDDE